MTSAFISRLRTKLYLCSFVVRHFGVRTSLAIKRQLLPDPLLGLRANFEKLFFIRRFEVAIGETDLESLELCVASDALPLDNGPILNYICGLRPLTLSNLQSQNRQRAARLQTHLLQTRLFSAPITKPLTGSTWDLLPTFLSSRTPLTTLFYQPWWRTPFCNPRPSRRCPTHPSVSLFVQDSS